MKKTVKNNIGNIIRTVLIILLSVMLTCSVQYVSQINGNENNVTVLSRLGSRGTEVRNVQSKLKSLGYYSGAVDGIYGVNTQTAVKKFQRNCGLTVDGIAGPKTLLYLGLGSSASSSAYTSNDEYLIAKVIAGESRGESYTGQVAVGAVILNRVKHSSFPNTVSGVIYQSGAFDCVRDSNWSVEPDSTAKKAAQAAINGWDPTGGAIYYYNPAKTSNKWILSRKVITVIGNHNFCI